MRLHFKIMLLVTIPLLTVSIILAILTQYHCNQNADTIVTFVEQAGKGNIRSLQKLNNKQVRDIKDLLLKQKKIYLRSEIQTLFSQIETFVKLERPILQAQGLSGAALERGLQKDVARMVEQARYGPAHKDYFWINDLQPVMVMHPYKPKLNGKDLSQVKDPNGKALFLEFVRVCKARGEGYVDYFWPKYGADKPQPKLSFVKLYRPWNWIIGTGVYIDDIQRAMLPLERGITLHTKNLSSGITKQTEQIRNTGKQAVSNIKKVLLWVTIGVLLVTLSLSYIFVKGLIGRPMEKALHFARELASGNLNAHISLKQKDEIGLLVQDLNAMASNLKERFRIDVLQKLIEKLTGSASELNEMAANVAAVAGDASQKTDAVSQASGEMTNNISSVAAAMEEATTNTSTVASAAEEMTSTITEIVQNTAKTKEVTKQAVEMTSQASNKVNQLGESAVAISKVTEAIASISAQTNLLALNATIEAARAGDAGKGFAVVANEIKELAQQTAEATEDISEKISEIQSSTQSTVQDIKEVVTVIMEVDQFVSSIAAAIEEQSVTTREIAENVAQASQGLTEVNKHVSQSAQFAGQIAGEIQDVNRVANDINNTGMLLAQHSSELNELAKQLREIVEQFTV